MGSISIQFYAFPEEIISFINEMQERFGLYIVSIDMKPFKASIIATKGDNKIQYDNSLKNISMFICEPNMFCERKNEFLDKNENGIHIAIGDANNNSLSESWLSIKTEDVPSLELAKKIASSLKKKTKAGIVFRNIDSNAESLMRAFRYTEKVRKAHEEGLQLLGLTPKLIGYIPEVE